MSGYRPSLWGSDVPSRVKITVNVSGATLSGKATTKAGQALSKDPTGAYYLAVVGSTSSTTYVFDAVLNINHDQSVTHTSHPIQTAAEANSHAYGNPSKLSLDIGMSDAMDSYSSSWFGSDSKSVAAYTTLLTFAQEITLLTVATKLRTYKNMIVSRITPQETSKTINGLRARVEFTQMLLATVTSSSTKNSSSSSRPTETNSTSLGQVTTESVSGTITKQYSTTGSNAVSTVDVPGAGTYSSTSTDTLSQLNLLE